ncbi:MAG: alpha/beta fold hydrolase [Acidimicrobiales bacterium]
MSNFEDPTSASVSALRPTVASTERGDESCDEPVTIPDVGSARRPSALRSTIALLVGGPVRAVRHGNPSRLRFPVGATKKGHGGVSEWCGWKQGHIGGWTCGAGDHHLVLVHGGPGLSDYLQRLGDLLADDLGEQWSIVRYQQRGLSPSTVQGPFTIEQEVQDLLTVCDGLGSDDVWLLGHSWGGHLAMHTVAADPDRFRGVVIIDPLGAVPDGGQAGMFNHFAARLSPAEAAEWMRLEELSASHGPTPERRLAQLAVLWPYYFSDPATSPPMPAMSRGPGDHSQSIAEHFDRETLVRSLPQVSTPALFLAGTKSPIPYEECERSAALMPRAEVVLLATGHFLWLEDPAATVAPVASFLRRTRLDAAD